MKFIYYYISIHSDDYTRKVESSVLEQFLISSLGFNKTSHLRFWKEISGERIYVKGISAELNGNYAIDTQDGVKEVNLIEIDLPRSIDNILELAITGIAVRIAKEFSWIIDEDHGLD
ncbi:hypothetical protein [Cohnella sp. GCM10012308]|uniref:hypothetical protein n=1 Tax=Cohnella sp. GCM10012308 TaxID=3317329 RepID=UPI00361ED4AB